MNNLVTRRRDKDRKRELYCLVGQVKELVSTSSKVYLIPPAKK